MALKPLNKPRKGDLDWDIPVNENFTNIEEYATEVDGKLKELDDKNDFTDEDKKKLDGIAEGANKYTHPTSAGNKHVPTGGVAGQILKYSANGTVKWEEETDTKYNAASAEANGLMSSADKAKLDGIAAGANKTTVTNNLTSTSTAAALSAAQGKKLNDEKADKGHTHDAQTSVTGNAATATKLQTPRTIDGVNFDGSGNITHYAQCTTAAGTAAKVATITGFKLATGARLTIKFTITNTAAAPTLNITSTGAKEIYFRGSKITNAAPTLQANGVYDLVYNGTAYEIVNGFAGGYGF